MRIPMKVDYGVRALVELALHYGEKPTQTSQIAAKQRIPEAYLDQLLTTLHRAGLIRSRRGPHGGHSLVRDPAEIDLSTVVATLEGTSPPLDCFIWPDECLLSSTCAQRDVWQEVEETIQRVLSSTSIGDLAQRQYHTTYQVASPP